MYPTEYPLTFGPGVRRPERAQTHACGHEVHVLHAARRRAHLLPLRHPLVGQGLPPHHDQRRMAYLENRNYLFVKKQWLVEDFLSLVQ